MTEISDMKTKTRKSGELEKWRHRVGYRAKLALPSGHELFLFPVIVQCIFIFPRKEEHFKKRGGLLSSAPRIPGNDLDKYYRAVGDSLSGVVYRDDRQITGMGGSRKRFGSTKNEGGVYVKIWEDLECG
jgi:Holliday junction resolvase RusA-like endonuclease